LYEETFFRIKFIVTC